MLIRAKQSNTEYQYSQYKPGDVLEVINEYDEHYVAKIISGSEPGGILAVHKNYCEPVHLGSYESDGPITMKI